MVGGSLLPTCGEAGVACAQIAGSKASMTSRGPGRTGLAKRSGRWAGPDAQEAQRRVMRSYKPFTMVLAVVVNRKGRKACT